MKSIKIMDHYLGDIYSIITAFCWSIAVVSYKAGLKNHNVFSLKISQNIMVIIFFALYIILSGGSFQLDLNNYDLFLVVISGILGITISDTFFMASLRLLGASGQALIDCLYSPLMIIWAYVAFGEKLGAINIFGGSLVISALFLTISRANSKHGSVYESSGKNLAKGLTYGILTNFTIVGTIMLIRHIIRDPKIDIVVLCFWRFFIGNLFLMFFTKFIKKSKLNIMEIFNKETFLWNFLASFSGPFLATIFWFLGFKYTLAGKAAIYNQMATIFIILWSTLFLKEFMTPKKFLASILAIIGAIFTAI